MAVDYCSPAAYRYISKTFHNHLPNPYTLRRWYRSVNGEPGITTESLKVLAEKAKEYKKQHGRELTLALMCDETSIRKGVEWNASQLSFSGFVSCENTEQNRGKRKKKKRDDGAPDVAKDVLVYMAVGDDFKIPIAYFFLSGLDATSRAALTQHVIRSTNETGARVETFTTDGLISNITMFKMLGVNFDSGDTFFKSPTNPSDKIYVFLDPPHVLKLARSCFATHNLFHEGKRISWDFVTELHKMQVQYDFNLGNKLTTRHINYHTRPMNVRITAETVSLSVADCIDQLREDGYPQFQDSYETTRYIRFVNNVFDIGNVKPNEETYSGYKQPICASTADNMFKYFKEAKEFFKSLEIDEVRKRKNVQECTRKLAIRSRSSTPFLGMIINLTSLESLYTGLLSEGLNPEL